MGAGTCACVQREKQRWHRRKTGRQAAAAWLQVSRLHFLQQPLPPNNLCNNTAMCMTCQHDIGGGRGGGALPMIMQTKLMHMTWLAI